MARIKQNTLNLEKGSIGGLVVYQMYGNTYVRAKPSSYKDAKSLLQEINRQKLMLVQVFLRPFKSLLRLSFQYEKGRSAYHAAMSYNMKSAVTGSYPNQEIDLSKVLLSKGDLPLPANIKMEKSDIGITIKWDYLQHPNSDHRDTLIVMSHKKNSCNAEYRQTAAQRSDTTAIFTHLNKDSGMYDIWIAFRKYDETAISDSHYLGSIEVVD